MKDRLYSLLGVRAFICILLIAGTILLYIADQNEAAGSMMTLTTMAVTWLYKARSDREASWTKH